MKDSRNILVSYHVGSDGWARSDELYKSVLVCELTWEALSRMGPTGFRNIPCGSINYDTMGAAIEAFDNAVRASYHRRSSVGDT